MARRLVQQVHLQITLQSEKLTSIPLENPCINPGRVGQKHQYLWAMGPSPEGKDCGFVCISGFLFSLQYLLIVYLAVCPSPSLSNFLMHDLPGAFTLSPIHAVYIHLPVISHWIPYKINTFRVSWSDWGFTSSGHRWWNWMWVQEKHPYTHRTDSTAVPQSSSPNLMLLWVFYWTVFLFLSYLLLLLLLFVFFTDPNYSISPSCLLSFLYNTFSLILQCYGLGWSSFFPINICLFLCV